MSKSKPLHSMAWGLGVAVCGIVAPQQQTWTPALVTCKKCLKRLMQLKKGEGR